MSATEVLPTKTLLSNGAWWIACGFALSQASVFFCLAMVIIARELPFVLLGFTVLLIATGSVMIAAGAYGIASGIAQNTREAP